jgi:hypothetical protein
VTHAWSGDYGNSRALTAAVVATLLIHFLPWDLMSSRRFPPPWSVDELEALHRSHVVRPLTNFIELCIAHRIRVDDVDNFPQVSAATAETSPYFSDEFLNELGTANFHHILFASRVFSLGLFTNRDGANHDETRRP